MAGVEGIFSKVLGLPGSPWCLCCQDGGCQGIVGPLPGPRTVKGCQERQSDQGSSAHFPEGSTALDGVPQATRGSRGHVCPHVLRVTRPGRIINCLAALVTCSQIHIQQSQLCVIFTCSEGVREMCPWGVRLLLDLAAWHRASRMGPQRPAWCHGGAWLPGP